MKSRRVPCVHEEVVPTELFDIRFDEPCHVRAGTLCFLEDLPRDGADHRETLVQRPTLD